MHYGFELIRGKTLAEVAIQGIFVPIWNHKEKPLSQNSWHGFAYYCYSPLRKINQVAIQMPDSGHGHPGKNYIAKAKPR